MKNSLLKNLLMVTLLTFNLSAMAEDIDLFVGVPAVSSALPNVLIVLDNTANWTSAFSNEMNALSSVVSALPADKFNVGLMLFTETGGTNSGNDGAYVRAAIRTLDTANKSKYINLISNLDVNTDKGNSGKVGKAMEESYLYFAGSAPYAGNNKGKTDFTGNITGNVSSNVIYALTGNALASKSSTTYLKPSISGCANSYVIYISNGAAQDSSADIAQATAALASAGGSTTVIPISPSGSQDNVADEWVRFMKKSSANITTYTLDINKVTTGQGPGFTALLKSMAGVSSGKYFDVASSGNQIADALASIFSEIQSVNSVFASVSLPVSVNTQGTFLNQVYIGMFRPDADSFPRWNGNLKQFKLGYINNVLQLLDADDKSAISSGGTGFIAECARSFWTPSTLDSYWQFRPQGNCLTTNTDISNTPDGNIVEKGAQAYKLRSTTTRNMKTCASAACTSLATFDSTTATQALLGAASTTERDALINWQLGKDVDDENLNAVTNTETRSSVHSDVVHSRPVAINHGTDASPQVVVYYGSNDGLLHAVNGNRAANIGTATAGTELWSFVAPEFYPKIKRLRDNNVTISFPGHTTGTPTPLPKDYGVDGAITAYKATASASIFSTMRRGGRAVYAFIVPDLTPANPSLLWKIGCPNAANDSGCTSGFSGLGQTWSAPKVIKAGGYGFGNTPMLIMGGGYDNCQDADPNTACNNSSKGNNVYIMDATTGALLRTLSTDSSVIADVAVVPDSAGLLKFAYVADLGGNIYRISGVTANAAIGTTAPGSWTITKIAALGGTGVNNRKFMFMPDLLEGDNGGYTILLGSGDREKPLSTYTSAAAVQNRFYVVKDNPTDTSWLTSENSTCGSNVMCNGSLFAITTSSTPTANQLAATKGWYLDLMSNEQVVTSAITVFNTVTFSTHQPTPPASGACTTLGTARVYNLDYVNAATKSGLVRGEIIVGGGLPPSPVAGMVTLDNGQTVPFIIGANPKSALQGKEPPPPQSAKRPKSRVYWNIKK